MYVRFFFLRPARAGSEAVTNMGVVGSRGSGNGPRREDHYSQPGAIRHTCHGFPGVYLSGEFPCLRHVCCSTFSFANEWVPGIGSCHEMILARLTVSSTMFPTMSFPLYCDFLYGMDLVLSSILFPALSRTMSTMSPTFL